MKATSTIQLHVDNPDFCSAGQLIQGCVSWTCFEDGENELRGLELELLGYEQVVITTERPNGTDNITQQQHQHVQKEILIKFPYTLHDFTAATTASMMSTKQSPRVEEEIGQSYEYPFEWELPKTVPNSFHYTTGTNETIEIVYQLTAKAIPTRGGRVTLQDTVSLRVQAAECAMNTVKAITIQPRPMNLTTNVIFPRGAVHWGWNTRSDVLRTGSTVEIIITGENRSHVDVNDFVVRLVETIVWKNPWTQRDNSTERIVASAGIEVNQQRQWQSQNPGAVLSPPTVVTLVVPDDDTITCESYPSGALARVEHSIVVIAQTTTDRTTNPRLASPVYVVRRRVSK